MGLLLDRVCNSITIPMYYKEFIDAAVDLDETPKICCPFHQERTPSFSYSAEKKLWRCWGTCKIGGDVVALHMRNMKLHSRDEALHSLANLIGIDEKVVDFTKPDVKVDMQFVHMLALRNEANQLAKTPDDWVELDYLTSQHCPQQDVIRLLEVYCNSRK